MRILVLPIIAIALAACTTEAPEPAVMPLAEPMPFLTTAPNLSEPRAILNPIEADVTENVRRANECFEVLAYDCDNPEVDEAGIRRLPAHEGR